MASCETFIIIALSLCNMCNNFALTKHLSRVNMTQESFKEQEMHVTFLQ